MIQLTYWLLFFPFPPKFNFIQITGSGDVLNPTQPTAYVMKVLRGLLFELLLPPFPLLAEITSCCSPESRPFPDNSSTEDPYNFRWESHFQHYSQYDTVTIQKMYYYTNDFIHESVHNHFNNKLLINVKTSQQWRAVDIW